MPVYTYFCNSCGKTFETYTSYPDFTITIIKCPKCGSNSVTRRITYKPIIYKGTGFYSIDTKPKED